MFPPVLRELPPPPLELYDLEEAFSSERTRLAQIANKCLPQPGEHIINEEADMDFFIHECAQIVRPTETMDSQNAKEILHDLAVELYQFKRPTNI